MKKTLAALLERYPDQIESISDESRSGDGYWVYLNYGWQRGNFPGTPATPSGGNSNLHCVHEWNMRDLTAAMRHELHKCDCWECVKELKEDVL